MGQIHEAGGKYTYLSKAKSLHANHCTMVVITESKPEWRCTSCEKRWCFICKDAQEDDCEHLARLDKERKEHDKSQAFRAIRRKQEQESAKEVARTAKKCPKAGCQAPIQWASDCAHMTCRRCKTEFCWVCKVIWKTAGKEERVPLHLEGCALLTTSSKKISLSKLNTTGYAPGWSEDPGYDKSNDQRLWLPSYQV